MNSSSRIFIGNPLSIFLNRIKVFGYIYRGEVKLKLGDLDGAESDFSKGINVMRYPPIDSKLYILRSKVRKQKGDLKGSKNDYQKVLDIGKKYLDKGSIGLACRTWKNASEPGNEDANELLKTHCK